MSPVTYKTHFLVGLPHYDYNAKKIVSLWQYAPSLREIQAAIDATTDKVYGGFVLVTPVGSVLPGNYVAPEPVYDYYGC